MIIKLTVAVRCDVKDKAEAENIRTAVETAVIPFADLSPTVTASVSENIDPIPDE